VSPPLQDKAEAMIERSFNTSHSPRIVYSAPSSPPTTSFLETGSDQLTKSDDEEEEQEESYVSESSKSRRRNLNRQQDEEDGQSKTSNSTSEYESVSSLSLDEISISKSARKNWKKESGHSVDGSSDDGNKWYVLVLNGKDKERIKRGGIWKRGKERISAL